MGDIDSGLWKPIRCHLGLKWKPEQTCTVYFFKPSDLIIKSLYRWRRVKNHEILIIGADEGPWRVEKVKKDDVLFLGIGGLSRPPNILPAAVLYDVPPDFMKQTRTGFAYSGEGLIHSSPNNDIEITYYITETE